MKRFIVGVFIFWIISHTGYVFSQDFEHPGILHNESDFARMRQKVAEKAEPWYTTWNNLLASPEASLSWTPRATATVIRGGTGDNISLMYRDVAAAYQHALIYKISGDVAHGNKAVQILNAWSSINTLVSGNADRYLAAGLNGYQFANAAEMMRGYPGFDLERFKKYMLNVFFYPMNERFIIGNAWGTPHNDACSTNYRVNWDICNMNAMLAISILCDNKTGFNEAINYCKSGDGTGNITRAINFVHSPIWGQWEESGRDQGHAVGGLALYELFCEIAWNQGVDIYSYNDCRYRKGAEYVARYNIMTKDSAGNTIGKYDDLPYTSYSRRMGSTCTWYTESVLSASVRGKYGSLWEGVYNHYVNRLNQPDKIQSINEIRQQQPSTIWPSVAIHADTYDTPGGGSLTFRSDSGRCILPWLNMDVNALSIIKLPFYGSVSVTDTSTVSIKASGTGIKGTADGFHFVFQRLIDDGEIIAKLTSLDEVNAICQAGLMIREKLNQSSKNIFLSLTSTNGVLFAGRYTTGDTTRLIAQNSTNILPCWLRLSRSGDMFTAYISADKTYWVEVGAKTIKMTPDVYIGMALSSNNKDTICSSLFENVEILRGNIKPVAKVLSPKNKEITYISPANVTITGIAYDIDGLLDKAELFINDSIYATYTTSSFTYTWKSVPEGTYTIKLKAYDNQGAIRISDTVAITVSAKTTKLPWYKFNETASGLYITSDASGNNISGYLNGSTAFATGKINNAISLDGVDDYVRMSNSFINKLSDFTFAGWVNISTQKTWARIFDYGPSVSSYMFLTPFNGSGVMSFNILSVNGTLNQVNCSTPVPAGSWQHVAVTLGADVCKVYLNGNIVGSNTSFMLRPYDIGIPTYNHFGKSIFSADPYLTGMLDDCRFFNYALSQVEVKALIDSVTTGFEGVGVKKVSFYPNPAKDKIIIEGADKAALTICNAMGQSELQCMVSSQKEEVNVNKLSKGVYLISILKAKQIIYKDKLVIE
jgi:hypothetical protein